MTQHELEQERDYWKQRCKDMQEDMKLFVGIVTVTMLAILVEILQNYFYPPLQ